MKIKTVISIYLIVLFQKASSQPAAQHFRYSFETAAYIQLEMLPSETMVFNTKAIWHTVRDNRFILLYLEEVNTESDIEGGIKKENWNDTLLFDLNTFKMYSANQKASYRFSRKQFPLDRNDRYVSKDTLVDCSAIIPAGATPSPTLFLNKGVRVYKTKRYTFKFIDTRAAEQNPEEYFVRFRNFRFSNTPLPFAY